MSYATIDDLLHGYADAVVHRDPDQWISTWATDAVWELGKGRRVEGADAILSLVTGSALVTGHVLPVEGGMLIGG